MSDKDDQPSTPAPRARKRTAGLWVAIGIGAAALAAAGVAVFVQRDAAHRTETALMALKPDELPANERLFAYARTEGAKVYAANCAACHGADMKGDKTKGAVDLTDVDWIYGGGLMSDLERTISFGIHSGHKGAWNLAVMPAYSSPVPHSVDEDERLPHLEPQQIYDAAEYLLSLRGRSTDAASAARGRTIFHRDGICFDCHADNAEGDPSTGVPNLHDDFWIWGGTKSDIVNSIAQGRRGVCPAWIEKLGSVKVREVAAYVKSRSKQSPYAITPDDLTPPLPNEIPPPPGPPEPEEEQSQGT
jgi:cbb3-type cytochrome c oxidase subunit III